MKEGGNRDLKRWCTVAISTGEMDMETFIASSGRKVKAGQLVRLLNIPLSKAECFHEYQNGKQHADGLKDAYQQHYGAAGRAWIEWLTANQQQAVSVVRESEERWRKLIPAEYGEQVHRVAARFASCLMTRIAFLFLIWLAIVKVKVMASLSRSMFYLPHSKAKWQKGMIQRSLLKRFMSLAD